MLVFDLFCVSAYGVLLVFYYASENKDRYDFFFHRQQNKANKSYKRLMKAMPNGIILLDQSNTPMFYNQLIFTIISKHEERSFSRSPNFDDEEQRRLAKPVQYIVIA